MCSLPIELSKLNWSIPMTQARKNKSLLFHQLTRTERIHTLGRSNWRLLQVYQEAPFDSQKCNFIYKARRLQNLQRIGLLTNARASDIFERVADNIQNYLFRPKYC